MAECGQVCSLVIIITVLLLSIAFLAILIVAKNSMEASSYDFIIDLGFNWSQTPMLGITASVSYSCSSSSSNFITDSWPGTVAGCNCAAGYGLNSGYGYNTGYSTQAYGSSLTSLVSAGSTGTTGTTSGSLGLYGGVSRGFCNRSYNSYERYCLDIYPIAPMPYKLWDGMGICASYSSTKPTYLELEVVNGACPTSKPIQCGRIDSLENVLCVATISECPINDLKIVTKGTAVPSGYTQVSLATRDIQYTNSFSTGIIAVQTKISDDQPCASPAEQSYYQGVTYILDYYYGKGACTTSVYNSSYDTSYIKLDTYPYSSLLTENQIMTVLLIKIPNYSQTRLLHDTSLYYKNFIGFKPACKSKLMEIINNDVKSFLTNLQIVGTTATESLSLGNTAFALSITTFVLILFWGGINLGYKIGCWENSSVGGGCCVLVVWAIIPLAMIIATMGVASAFTAKIMSIGNAHTILSGCMDNKSEAQLSNFVLNVANVQKLSLLGALFSAFTVTAIILEIIIWRCSSNLRCVAQPETYNESPYDVNKNYNDGENPDNQPNNDDDFKVGYISNQDDNNDRNIEVEVMNIGPKIDVNYNDNNNVDINVDNNEKLNVNFNKAPPNNANNGINFK